MKAIISGGGTGGHIFPAIAIAQELKRRDANTAILFVGANGRMEMEKVPQAGFDIKGLDVVGLNRSSIFKNFSLPWKLFKSLFAGYKILKAFNPSVVIGVGGYASAPMLYLATWLKIPTLIQEQNSYAGKTNKILGKKVNRICVAYENMDKFFPKEKMVITGNPVRSDLINLHTKKEEGFEFFKLSKAKKTILVLGGSLGARSINESMASQTQPIDEQKSVQWIWQYGKQGINSYSNSPTAKLEQVRAMAFIDRADLAYAVADVILCRAGALTISEILIANKPVVLVPAPTVAEDHQTHNAMALTNKGAAWLLSDKEVIKSGVRKIIELLYDDQTQVKMKNAQLDLAKPEAAHAIVDEIVKLNLKAA